MRQPPAYVRPRMRAGRRARHAAVALVAVGLLVPGTGTVAHDALVGSDPADGAVLDAAPTQLVLTFAAEQVGVGAEISVTGTDGSSWVSGAAQVDGTTVTQPLLAGMPDDAYAVAWRSVAQDGHPVTGTLTFEVAAGVAGPTAAAPTESAPTAAVPAPAVTAVPAPAGGGVPWAAVAASTMALVAAGVLVGRRRAARG